MAARWRDPSAFRADPTATPAAHPSRRQTLALITVLVLVAGAVAVASYVIRPDRAKAFELFHGSLFLSDQSSPVAVDLASGKPTLRLVGADSQVGITDGAPLAVVPLDGGTLLLNQKTGEFNMVDSGGFVMKHDGGGVPLGGAVDPTTKAMGVADGQLAYIVRTGPARTDVYLVSQSTVQSALSATSAVKPRASTAMTDFVAGSGRRSAVAADGDLWLLGTKSGQATGQQTIRQLRVPSDSSTGAQLDVTDHGPVPRAAAIGTASSSDGSTAVGVATTDQIKIFSGSSLTHTVPYRAEPGVDQILAAGNSGGRLGFLLHAAGGWSLVSVRPDGSELRGPTRIADVPATAALISPVYSADTLYTMAKGNGRLFQIGSDARARPVPVEPTYPFGKVGGDVVETSNVSDGYVVARGSRVVFNSPTHANALMLFTDGSHPPRRIQKGEAVNVSASGGADQLTRSTINPTQTGKPPTDTGAKPPPPGAAPVNNKLDCKNITQKPHIPTIDQITPGSRSVLLHWTYPILDPKQDCRPSTYVVHIKKITPSSPDPASSSVTVDGQDGINLTGLFPNTAYYISVTALIHGQGTTSATLRTQTGPEGPAAPTGLTVAADESGNWQLSWNACGTVAQGCVPAETWTVTPSLCDAHGVNEPPAPVTETADPTSKAQPPLVYKGNDSLLGAGLQFVVTGAGQSQVPGTPSAKSACVHSWSPPDPGAMTLTASHPANTSLNGTTSTTVSLDLGTDPVRAVGGVGARIAFHLTGPGADQTKTETFTGSASSVAATFPGLSAGAQYNASVTVSPPGHPDRSVSLGPTPVTTAADWPDSLDLSADCTPPDRLIKLNCALHLTISGLSSSDAHGETFDIVDTDSSLSGVRCGGGPNHSLTAAGVTLPYTVDDTLSLFEFNGTCTVTVHLQESATATPVFGGVVKTLTTTYTVGDATTYPAKSGDFTAQWDSGPGSQALIKYTGTDFTADQLALITQNWNVTVQGPKGQSCGSRAFDNPPDGVDVPASSDCVRAYGDQTGWSVHITYQDANTTNSHAVPGDPALEGTPPGYQPCNVTDSGFTAAWGATRADPVTVTYAGDQAQISGCSSFSYTLQKDGADCGSAASPAPPGSSTITPTCDLATPGSWTVQITWHNDDTGTDDQVNPDIKLPDPPAT